MRSSPATATATPSATPRPSSDAPTTTFGKEYFEQVSLAEPVPTHLNPPVPPQVSEFSMAYVGSPGKEVSSGECPGQGGGVEGKRAQDVPPAAHIPKARAGASSHRKVSAQISRAIPPKEVEYSKTRIQGGTSSPLEAKGDSGANEALNSPFVSKFQNIWGNCIKTITTNPFRKIATRGKGEDKGLTPGQQNKEDKKIQVGISGSTEEVVQECVTGKTWWDFPMAMQGFRTPNPSQHSDTSYLQNTLFRAGVRESFREAKAYGYRKWEADQENDPTKVKNMQTQEDNSGPMIQKNENHKTSKNSADTQGYEVKPTQKNLADIMLPKGDNSELEIPNLDRGTDHISNPHMDQGIAVQQPVSAGKRSGVELSKGKKVQGRHNGTKSQLFDLIEADTSRGDDKTILVGNDHKELVQPANDEPCWVHRWLASYSAPEESPETAVANTTSPGKVDSAIQKNIDETKLEYDDNWVARWLKSYGEAS